MASVNIPLSSKSEDLPYLYWIPKLHKNPYKQRYIAGSSNCSTKELSITLTKILSAVKEGLQKYCYTVYSRSGINHMWILKNSKELLENFKSRSFYTTAKIFAIVLCYECVVCRRPSVSRLIPFNNFCSS